MDESSHKQILVEIMPAGRTRFGFEVGDDRKVARYRATLPKKLASIAKKMPELLKMRGAFQGMKHKSRGIARSSCDALHGENSAFGRNYLQVQDSQD
jgi:hypothetical protein